MILTLIAVGLALIAWLAWTVHDALRDRDPWGKRGRGVADHYKGPWR